MLKKKRQAPTDLDARHRRSIGVLVED